MTAVVISKATQLRGSVRVPGDKSASHRALMLSALADGVSTIAGLSPGLDVRGTSDIIQQLGAKRVDDAGLVSIEGPSAGLVSSASDLDCGNSGTTMRLLTGLLSAVDGKHRLKGDPSLSQRPMDRVAVPLRLMGAEISGVGQRVLAPLTVTGSTLRGINYNIPVPSAQVKSAIILAGLSASGTTVITEAVRTRTTTEDMLRDCGVDVVSNLLGAGREVTITPGRPRAHHWQVPADPSQAAFFCVLGAIHHDGDIRVENVEASDERIGFLKVLERMGASLRIERVGAAVDITARSSQLHATEIHSNEIPSVDEAPILTIAAAAASGTTAFRDMGELRLKESDRFEGCLTLARSLGARAWSEGDDFFVEGLGGASAFTTFSIEAGLDHRIVMSSAVAGVAGNGCTIHGADTVASSYPHFFDDVRRLQ